MGELLETAWRNDLDGVDARDADAFVGAAKGGHYAQGRAWARVAVAGRRRAASFFLARAGGRLVGAAVVLRPRIGPVLAPVAVVERGPVCADVRDLGDVVAALAGAARRRGVLRLSVTPYWAGDDAVAAEAALGRVGFRSVQGLDGAHARTLRVDVGAKADDTFLGGAERRKLRYELRNAVRAGVSVRCGGAEQIATLARLDAALAASQGRRHRAAWFDAIGEYLRADPERGAVVVCEHAGEPISAVLVLRHARMAVYCAGASVVAARPFSKTALPLVAAARWARDVGCELFDLGGIPLEGDVDPKRAAIARFKRDFSKTPVRLVREHARWF